MMSNHATGTITIDSTEFSVDSDEVPGVIATYTFQSDSSGSFVFQHARPTSGARSQELAGNLTWKCAVRTA
jgi:hypothetical protein